MNIRQWLVTLFYCIASVTLAKDKAATLAVENDWAPYAYVESNGVTPTGFSVNLVREVFADQSIEIEFQSVPFARCLVLAEKGEVVGCFNATITEGNRDTYHWHPTAMFYEELAIFSHKDNTESGLTGKDLHGKSLGYTIGYTYPTYLMEAEDISRQGVNSDEQLIKLLIGKRVEYAMLNEMPAYYRMQQMNQVGAIRKVGTVSKDGFWVAFSKQHPQGKSLSETFEKGLANLHKNGRYQKLRESFEKSLTTSQ